MISNAYLAELFHWICAVIYFLVGCLIVARGPRSPIAWWLAIGCSFTSLWAITVAFQWPPHEGGLIALAELVRSSAWYGFLLCLYRRSEAGQTGRHKVFTLIGLVGLPALICLQLSHLLLDDELLVIGILQKATHLALPISVLLLLENLYFNTSSEDRWNFRLICIALASVFTLDLLVVVGLGVFRQFSLFWFEARIVGFIVAAPLVALAAARNRSWEIKIHVSREVVFHGASLVIAGSGLVILALIGEILRARGAGWGHIIESAIVVGGMTPIVALLSSGSFRTRLRILLAEHFFSYRYDYRREWVRCINLLTAPDAHVGLYLRAIRTVAAVVDSPAGAIFVRAPDEVAFRWAGSWNSPTVLHPVPPGDLIVKAFGHDLQIVVISNPDLSAKWQNLVPRAWIAVPLRHFGELIGFVILAHSRVSFSLDREAFDLLRIVGQEIGSRVVEQWAAQALVQTSQLREYSQRFAFVLHDIKNVSGQLGMLLSNAEVHAHNPAFQHDMISTIRASVDKITKLLTRLQAERIERDHAPLSPVERILGLINGLPAPKRSRLVFRGHRAIVGVAMSPDSFDTIVTHLVNNALEASLNTRTVHVLVRRTTSHILIDVSDQGAGMSADFIRDHLFRPFATTKAGGHGIGAYQAQELARASGGDLLVYSQVNIGTTMRLLFPAIQALGAEETHCTELGGYRYDAA